MGEKSRTEYSAINTTVALISRIIAILMGFVTRVVFTHVLNENYVGINGLFTDILNVLSLTELGVGTAITYALYRPIAQKDIKKQQQHRHVDHGACRSSGNRADQHQKDIQYQQENVELVVAVSAGHKLCKTLCHVLTRRI